MKDSKLTAYEIYKLKKEKTISDENFKRLLKENKIIVCKTCMGSGKITYGGSFGGETHTVDCHCKHKLL